MAIAATSGHRSGGAVPRATLAIAALLLLGTGAWFTASWIDTGGEATCGAVIHPSHWLADRNGCRGVMALRGTIGAATIAAGGAFLYIAAIRRAPAAAWTATIFAIAAVTSGALLLINELVRSDGAF